MTTFLSPFRVGLLVVAMAGSFVAFSFVVGGHALGHRDTYRVFAIFNDASGLVMKSRVQIAGIEVGNIDHVELLGGRAKITLRIRKAIVLHEDAAITKRPESILGDYLIDLAPGQKGRQLEEGDEIHNVRSAVGVEEVFDQLARITGDIRDVTKTLRDVLGGEGGKQSLRGIVAGMEDITRKLNETIGNAGSRLDRILANAEGFTDDVRGFTQGEKGNVRAIVEDTRAFMGQAREVLASIQSVIGSGQGDLKASVSSFKATLAKVDHALDQLSTVAESAKSGEGVVGKLLNDKELARKLDATVTDASDIVNRVVSLKTEISTRSELFVGQQNAAGQLNPQVKNYLSLRILPAPDKWYGVEFIDDPRGTVEVSTIRKEPPGSTEVSEQRVTTTTRAIKASVFLARRFGPASFRFGLLENTGGFGGKLHLAQDRVEFAADMFEFANPLKTRPRLRLLGNWAPISHVYVTAGLDDLLNPTGPLTIGNHVLFNFQQAPGTFVDPTTGHVIRGLDVFVGGGITFDDRDLRVLIGLLGSRL